MKSKTLNRPRSCRDQAWNNSAEYRAVVRGDSMLPRYPDGTAVLFRRLKSGERLVVGRNYLFRVQKSRWVFADTFKRLYHVDPRGNLVVANTRAVPGKSRTTFIRRADVFWIGEPIEVRKWVKIGGGHA